MNKSIYVITGVIIGVLLMVLVLRMTDNTLAIEAMRQTKEAMRQTEECININDECIAQLESCNYKVEEWKNNADYCIEKLRELKKYCNQEDK